MRIQYINFIYKFKHIYYINIYSLYLFFPSIEISHSFKGKYCQIYRKNCEKMEWISPTVKSIFI